VAKWINRTVVAAPRNGTASHTISFIPATSGSLLVGVIEGAVTSTTPTGWTLPTGGSAVNNTGLYVWYKTATAGEASFATTHNGSNYPVVAVVYEFAAGSTFVGAASAINQAAASSSGPTLSGLTGTNLLVGTVATGVNSANSTVPTTTWSSPAGLIEDVDQGVLNSGTDGYALSVVYVEDSTATSWNPTSAGTGNVTVERITFAVKATATGSAFTGSAALSGAGVLSTARTVAVAAAVALSGAGGLSATGAPGASRTVALTGAGTVAVAGSVATSATVKLSGSGQLGATGAASSAGTGAAALAGSGSLTATGSPAYAGTVTLTGTGALTGAGAGSQAGAVAAPLTGAGSLAAAGHPTASAAVSLAGAGTLTARGFSPSSVRDINITVGHPAGNPLTLGSPTGHALTIGQPVGHPLTVRPPEA